MIKIAEYSINMQGDLISNGPVHVISEDTCLTLQCEYKILQPTNSPRAMGGNIYRQQSHDPYLSVTISGSGWKPSILAYIKSSKCYWIECISPMLASTIPAVGDMRTDAPYIYKTMEVRDKIMMDELDWDIYYPELSPGVPNPNKPVLQDTYYLYFPKLYAFANNPTMTADASGNFNWSVEFVGRSTFVQY